MPWNRDHGSVGKLETPSGCKPDAKALLVQVQPDPPFIEDCNMTLNEFLEKSKEEFRDRGTIFMIAELDKLIARDLTDLSDVVVETKELRDTFEKFSVEFQYHWSLLTYVEDLNRRFKELVVG